MALDLISTVIVGLFGILNLGISWKLKRDFEVRLDRERAAFEGRVKAAVETHVQEHASKLKRKDDLFEYYQAYFVQLNDALRSFEDLTSEPKISLPDRIFVLEYGEALRRWSSFTAFSAPKEDIVLPVLFLADLGKLKKEIETLTLVLALSRNDRQQRVSEFPTYIQRARVKQDSLKEIIRTQYGA